MERYLKCEASFALISFEAQQNDNWIDNIQWSKLIFELPFWFKIELEVNLIDWNVYELENERERV